jgi:hypothetical protein
LLWPAKKPIATVLAAWFVTPAFDPRAIVVVFTVSRPFTVTFDPNVETPPCDDVYVTTNELAVVVPVVELKIRAALPPTAPALL